MRNRKNLEWCVNLCRANKEMMRLSQIEIQDIVDEYSILRKTTDFLFARINYEAAQYIMASRFVKKYI